MVARLLKLANPANSWDDRRSVALSDELSNENRGDGDFPVVFPSRLNIAGRLKVVLCVRHPLEVALSLKARHSASSAFSVSLWKAYNERVLAATTPEDRLVTHFDAYFDDARAELERLLTFARLEITGPALDAAASIISGGLRHHRLTSGDLAAEIDPDVIDLYKRLLVEAGRPQTVAAVAALDRTARATIDTRIAVKDATIRVRDVTIREVLKEVNTLSRELDETRRRLTEFVEAPAREYAQLKQRLHHLVDSAIPSHATVLVVSGGDDAFLHATARQAWHFPRTTDGTWNGYPGTSQEAIGQLEAIRAAGGIYLVFPAPERWWLDYYADLRRYLHESCRLVVDRKHTAIVFEIPAQTSAMRESTTKEEHSVQPTQAARPADVPLHFTGPADSYGEAVSRSELIDPGPKARVVWTAGVGETRDFLTTIDMQASAGLEREPIATRLRDHTYTAPPLRFGGLRNCYAMPAWGVVFDADGAVNRDAGFFAEWLSPDLSALPGVDRTDGVTRVKAEALLVAAEIPEPHLLLHHAGQITYGHWMMDCILGAWVLSDEIRDGRLRLLAAPLQRWHRQTIEALGLPLSCVTETSRDIVRCRHLIVPSSLNIGNLQRPPALLRDCFRALRRSCPPPENPLPKLPRIYIGRGGTGERRTMRNEAALVAALEARGFVSVYPRGLSIAQQVHLFAGAECVVGALGSALVNAVYMNAGSHVVEISTTLSKSNFWIARLCGLLGLRYATTIVDVADEDRDEKTVYGVPRPDLDYQFDADVSAVLHALDVFGFH